MNILISDDEEQILDLLEENITSEVENVSIFRAANGEQALGIAKNIKMDVIITDFLMPIRNGVDFLNETRKNSMNIKTQVIFLSGHIPKLKGSNNVWENVFLIEKTDGLDEVLTYIKRISKTVRI